MKFKGTVCALMLCLGLVFLCGAGMYPNAEELLTLKDQGDEEAAKEKAAAEQDRVFQVVTKAIISGQIKKGIQAADIRKNYGGPEAVVQEPGENKWLYMARPRKKWLEVPRIWLYFDQKGVLTDWECVYTQC